MLYTHPIDAIDDRAIFDEFEEIPDSAPLDWQEGLSDEEIEEGEKYMAWVKAEANKEYTQVKRDFVEHLRATNLDIVDYCHSHDIPLWSGEADRLAEMAGYRQSTWSDQRNVYRRAKEATARVYSRPRLSPDKPQTAQSGQMDATTQAPKIVSQRQPEHTGIKPNAATVAAMMQEAAKGLNYTKKAALYELAAAKLESRLPKGFVSKLPRSTRADLDVRIELVWTAALQWEQEARQHRQRQQEARERAEKALAPVVRQVQAYHRALMQMHPHASRGLVKSWEIFEYHVSQRLEPGYILKVEDWEPVCEGLLKAATKAADGAVKFSQKSA